MAPPKQAGEDFACELARRISEALVQERFVPRFVDSYVVEHGRYALQTHAPRYRELLTLLAREALLTATLCVLAEMESRAAAQKGQERHARIHLQRFREGFLSALTRQRKWTAGDALDFQTDLRVYEELATRAGGARSRKAPPDAGHPFVDRCAILLDPSFIEQARVAAAQALRQLQGLCSTLVSGLRMGKD